MDNNFTGTVPESLYSCSDLTALRLSSNGFHGQLSPGIGRLKSLRFLSLTNNSFTNVTNALQVLKSAPSLTTLLIGANFRGEAMPEDETIEGYRSLQVLSLADCSLSGEIPRWVSGLENLRELFLSTNRLTGPIPAWLSGLSLLFVLDVSNNSLAGEIPTALADLPMLRSETTVDDDDDDGGSSSQDAFPLPVYVAASLQYHTANYCPKLLNLGDNGLTGAVPPEIGRLKGLTQLNLSFNSLRGEVPQAVGNLTNLEVLDLSSNRLTGEVPRALESLHFLSYFNVSNNELDGPVPAGGQFCTFPSSSFAGNPEMCGPMLVRRCSAASVKAGRPAPVRDAGLCGGDVVVFAVAFGVFVGVGVLYDQMVLSRYFG
ncbi:Tyrosine-sulfated glycopeptide receptor 1 [Zea mays]|uniref:Tyrosine-sulfated glycopeptide receptor 1 n=1 Tax=Zea mays TaxID=4577 RepID=A0A3L6F8G7_MAIZE|nr:Tyrosine-sulfated glycopeptide receptor 1 [Zea mays]